MDLDNNHLKDNCEDFEVCCEKEHALRLCEINKRDMTQEEFFYRCMDVIEHWLYGNRKLSDLRKVTDKLYNEVTRPHWISVDKESEPPKEHEWIIGFSLKRSYVDIYNFDSNGLFEAHGITHWMPLPKMPVLSKTENTGKVHLIDANNMIEGGEE